MGTDIVATLSPKHDGRLTIPGLSWDGEHTQALTVIVDPQGSGNGNGGGAPAPNVFLETTVDEKQPYVQAEVRLTVRIYAAQTLYQPSLEMPGSSDTLIQQVGTDERSRTERNGQVYDTLTRHYVVFPQRSGHLQLTAPVLQAQVANRGNRSNPFGADPFSGFFGNGSMITTRPIRVHGQNIELDVKARPADIPASYWIPARELELSSESHPKPLQVHAGDPATLDLHIRAVGLTGEQLPDLTRLLDLPAALKQYPDQAKLANTTQGADVVGSRDQSIALIADQPGQFVIPALTLRWWDTQRQQMRTATLPGNTIDVLPAVVGSVAPQASSSASQSQAQPIMGQPSKASSPRIQLNTAAPPHSSDAFWRPLALGSFLLWLVTIGTMMLLRRRNAQGTKLIPGPADPATPRAGKARAAFHAACRNNDPQAARRSLMDWVAAGTTAKRPSGLNALAREADNPLLTPLLRELDRACYVGGEWSGQALAAALQDLPAGLQSTSDRDRTARLAPLYR